MITKTNTSATSAGSRQEYFKVRNLQSRIDSMLQDLARKHADILQDRDMTWSLHCDFQTITAALQAGYKRVYLQFANRGSWVCLPNDMQGIKHMVYSHTLDIRTSRHDALPSAIYALDLALLQETSGQSWRRSDWWIKRLNADQLANVFNGMTTPKAGKGNRAARRYAAKHGLEIARQFAHMDRQVMLDNALDRMVAHYNTVKVLPGQPVVVKAIFSEAMDHAGICGQLAMVTTESACNYVKIHAPNWEWSRDSYVSWEIGIRKDKDGNSWALTDRNKVLFDLQAGKLGNIQDQVKDMFAQAGIAGQPIFGQAQLDTYTNCK